MKKRMMEVGRFVQRKISKAKYFLEESNAGMGTVEIILIIVVIFTIYKGCK